MKLKACFSAKEFSRRRAKGMPHRQTTAWIPIGLRWRRVSRLRALPIKRSPAASVSNTWFPQFHLHFAPKEMASERASRIFSPASHAMDTGLRRVREWPLPGRTMMTDVRRVEYRARKSLRTRESLALRYCISKGVAFDTKGIGAQRVPPQTKQTFRGVFATGSRHIGEAGSHRRHIVANAKAQIFDPLPRVPLQLWIAGQKVQQGRRIELAQLAPPHAANRSTVSIMDRTPELVWRARPASQTNGIAEMACDDTAHSSLLMEQTPMPRAIAPAAPLHSMEKNPLGSMVLDAALVDRIAEDVIRRVERHVRIERERRGG